MDAALVRAGDSWRGEKITLFEARQLDALREGLERAHPWRIKPVAASATPNTSSKVSSKIGT